MYQIIGVAVIICIILIVATVWKRVSIKKSEERIRRRLDFIIDNPRIWKIINHKLLTGELSSEEYDQIIKLIENGDKLEL